MKSRDIFDVALRIVGLLFMYQGLTTIPNAIASICPVFPHFYWKNLLPSVIMVGWPLGLAWWLIRGAPWLMRLAYGRDGESRNAELLR